MTDTAERSTPHWDSAAMNSPETAEELADRLNQGLRTSLQMYGAVHSGMFPAEFEVCILPFGPTPAEPTFIPQNHEELAGQGVYTTNIRRVIPDVAIAGVATPRPDGTIRVDYTITGTLPDGWPLHLHQEMTLWLERGKVVRYLIKHDPDEMRRYLVAMGNPYSGGGLAQMEVG